MFCVALHPVPALIAAVTGFTCQLRISFFISRAIWHPWKAAFSLRLSQVTSATRSHPSHKRCRSPRSWHDLHRQDLLRPEGRHAGGRLAGLQRVPGTGGADRERGLALRRHRQGLQWAQPASEQIPPSAGGPGVSMQPVWVPGKRSTAGNLITDWTNYVFFFSFVFDTI